MRKLIAGLLGLALVAAGGFYLLTDPAAYRLLRGEADLPANHAADIENGRILFFAGGCSSCHATPNQPDGTRLGGGYALRTPFGTFSVPNISPHRARRHRRLGRRGFRPRHAGGRLPARAALLSRLSVHFLSADAGGRPDRSLRLPEDAARRSKAARPITICRSPSASAAASDFGSWPSSTGDLHAGCIEERELEPGSLSRRGAGPLRGVPQRAQRRSAPSSRSAAMRGARIRKAGRPHRTSPRIDRDRRVVGRGLGPHAEDRRDAELRQCERADGLDRPQHGPAPGPGSGRHRRVPPVAPPARGMEGAASARHDADRPPSPPPHAIGASRAETAIQSITAALRMQTMWRAPGASPTQRTVWGRSHR